MKNPIVKILCIVAILIGGYFYWLEYVKPIPFNDMNLKNALLENVGYSKEKELTRNALKKLQWNLNLSDMWIKDLEGIQYCINVKSIDLGRNLIGNISPLFELTNLQELYLPSARINNDIKGIKNLKNLIKLDLSANKIEDISELSELYKIETLELSRNKISDLSPLSSLKNLKDLYAYDNEISSVSPLSNLINLEILDLSYNSIADLRPISNLTNLKILNLDHNPITDLSPLSNLRKLKISDRIRNTIEDKQEALQVVKDYFYWMNERDITKLNALQVDHGLNRIYNNLDGLKEVKLLSIGENLEEKQWYRNNGRGKHYNYDNILAFQVEVEFTYEEGVPYSDLHGKQELIYYLVRQDTKSPWMIDDFGSYIGNN